HDPVCMRRPARRFAVPHALVGIFIENNRPETMPLVFRNHRFASPQAPWLTHDSPISYTTFFNAWARRCAPLPTLRLLSARHLPSIGYGYALFIAAAVGLAAADGPAGLRSMRPKGTVSARAPSCPIRSR